MHQKTGKHSLELPILPLLLLPGHPRRRPGGGLMAWAVCPVPGCGAVSVPVLDRLNEPCRVLRSYRCVDGHAWWTEETVTAFPAPFAYLRQGEAPIVPPGATSRKTHNRLG